MPVPPGSAVRRGSSLGFAVRYAPATQTSGKRIEASYVT